MDTSRIMNEIDNAENDAELKETMDVILDDIAAQAAAAVVAVSDNPNVTVTTVDLGALMNLVEQRVVVLLQSG